MFYFFKTLCGISLILVFILLCIFILGVLLWLPFEVNNFLCEKIGIEEEDSRLGRLMIKIVSKIVGKR